MTDSEQIKALLDNVYTDDCMHIFAKVRGNIVHLGTGDTHEAAALAALAHGIASTRTNRAVLIGDTREFFLVRP